MGLTALLARGEGLGAAAVADYCGAGSAFRFSDPQAEFAALRTNCGVYDLGYRAKLLMTGSDRVRWLNGMVTNNIRDLAAGRGVYAFLLNPQGHILGDLYAYNRGDSIIVDTEYSQVGKIVATFDHHIIMDDVEVKNLSETLTALGLGGPNSSEVLRAAGFAVSDMTPLEIQSAQWRGMECTLVCCEDEQDPSYQIWVAPDGVRQLWDTFLQVGAVAAGSEALELRRIVAGIPRYGVDIRERDLPQETEQARALNFNKGCYVGQEIVERIRSRGAVHRKFSGFLADAPVTPGSKIVSGEKEVGEITSAASVRLANQDRNLALGYIRREIGTPAREVMLGATKATVVSLPITEAAMQQNEKLLAERPA